MLINFCLQSWLLNNQEIGCNQLLLISAKATLVGIHDKIIILISSIESLIWKCGLTKQPYWMMTGHLFFKSLQMNPMTSGSKWSSSLAGPEDTFGYWWKPYCPSLACCSQLATGSGNFLCSCAFFFLNFHIPFYLLRILHKHKSKWYRSGHILQDRICCLWHVSGRFLFYLTLIPSCTQDGHTYI